MVDLQFKLEQRDNKLAEHETTIKNLSGKLTAVQQQADQLRDYGSRLVDDVKELEKNAISQDGTIKELESELNYQQLRERKILYLVQLLQSRGYPVQNIYDSELKNVKTTRIAEFLKKKEEEAQELEYGGPELDEKYHYSFHTDDSFEAICSGP